MFSYWKMAFIKRGIIFLFICLTAFAIHFVLINVTFSSSAKDLLRSFTLNRRSRQRIESCSCDRDYFYQSNENQQKLNSTCSDEGTFYQLGQKVIAMSMYLKDHPDPKQLQLFLDGLKENLKMMRKLYPGMSLRLYTDAKLENEFCEIVCQNPDLFWCDIKKTPSLGDQHKMFFMTWRFLPLGDPTVEYFLSRDLDSVVSNREAAVLKEWLKTSKPFHLMRDHVDHNAPILGGTWGARNNLLGRNAEEIRKNIIDLAKTPAYMYHSKGGDQFVLNDAVYYPRANEIVAFDSYHCKTWTQTAVKPFPVKRENNKTDFVGNFDLGRAVYDLKKCPVDCRPEYGKDWEYC